MKTSEVMRYQGLESYEFEDRPKGELFSLTMNPYTGVVFLGLEKHASSSAIALDILRKVVKACNVMERDGVDDPLRVLAVDGVRVDVDFIADEVKVYRFDEEGEEGREGNSRRQVEVRKVG